MDSKVGKRVWARLMTITEVKVSLRCWLPKFIIICLAIVLLSVIFLSAPSRLWAEDECVWKEVTGEALAETITIEEAKKLALKRARLSAAEEVAGIHILGGNLIYSGSEVKGQALVDFMLTMTEGYIFKEEIVKWDASFKTLTEGSPPIPFYQVQARCCVSKGQEERDSFFRVSLETNKPIFISGEWAKLKITTSRDAYIAIFHLSSEEKMRLLLPDQFQKRSFLKEGEELSFPAAGLGMKVINSSSKDREVEYFVVAATKEWFDFAKELKMEKDIPISSFYTVLLTIPAKERALAIGGYEVIGKK